MSSSSMEKKDNIGRIHANRLIKRRSSSLMVKNKVNTGNITNLRKENDDSIASNSTASTTGSSTSGIILNRPKTSERQHYGVDIQVLC